MCAHMIARLLAKKNTNTHRGVLIALSINKVGKFYMEWLPPTRMILYGAEPRHIRYSVRMELGIQGQ